MSDETTMRLWAMTIVLVLTLFFTITISVDIVDLRKPRIVNSIEKRHNGYKICFEDDDFIRNSCILVSDNKFHIGDTISLEIYYKTINK